MPRCTFYARGRCTRGTACPFSHDAAGPAEAEFRSALHSSVVFGRRPVSTVPSLRPVGKIQGDTAGEDVSVPRHHTQALVFMLL